MKVAIIGGGGVVGSTAAYRIAQDGMASEIILVDVRPNMAEAHALDIEQAIVRRAAYPGESRKDRGCEKIQMSSSWP